jgi:hypothetical protein
MSVLCLPCKSREMAVGSNASWHQRSTQINTPYLAFNATKWPNAGGTGWAMLLALDFNGWRCFWRLCTWQRNYGVILGARHGPRRIKNIENTACFRENTVRVKYPKKKKKKKNSHSPVYLLINICGYTGLLPLFAFTRFSGKPEL